MRPRRMFRRGRPADPLFTPGECLYFRCLSDWVNPNGHVKPANVRFPDQSVNRQKYSKAGDVLIPDDEPKSPEWIFWGVARLTVGEIPGDILTSGGVMYAFSVEHDPREDNYGHSELRVYKNGARERNSKKINEGVKKKYRTDLALRTRVVVKAVV